MLNKLLEDNYKEILTVATRITRKKDRHIATELINETFLQIAERNKVIPTDNIGFVMYFSKYMKLMFMGERSSFNRNINGKEVLTESETYLDFKNELKALIDTDAELEIELGAEETNEVTKDLLSNLSHMTYERVKRYAEVIEFRVSLPPWEKELFDMHFELGLSSRQIADLMKEETGYEMHPQRCKLMIKEIKNKIKETWLNS